MFPNTSQAVLGEYVDDIDVTVNNTNRYFLESGIANDTNEISIFETRVDVEFDINPDNDVSFDLDFINKHVFLDSSSAMVDLPGALVGRGMRVGTKFPIPFLDDPDYRLGLSVIPSYYTDSWEDSFNDFETGAFRWVSEIYIDYRGTEPFQWKFGAIILPEQTDAILPYIDIRYAFDDYWSVRLLSDDFGVLYQPNEQWEFFTEFGYVIDEYEISSGGIDGRVLRQKQNTVGVGVQYNVNETNYVKFSGGWGFNRLLEFQDKVDDTEVDVDSAPYFTLEIAWTF